MRPPFLGSRILDEIALDDIEPLIDRESLFAGRWQFRQGMESEKWEAFKNERVIPIYERWISECRANPILIPKAIYGHFECAEQGNGLLVTHDGKSLRFDFPRERNEPHRCLADFFGDGFISMHLTTVGSRVIERAAALFAKNKYSEVLFLKGIAAGAAEAIAEFCHAKIRQELGVDEKCGERFSPGFPVFPNLLDQKKIFSLLKPKSIGLSLSETCQMVPEYSTSAIVSVDPKATYFRP